MTTVRERQDRCPGLFRPWPASDGLLVRLRLVGGRLPEPMARQLVAVAQQYGDGRVRVTNRGNLQLRALPDDGTGRPTPEVIAGIVASGIEPSRAHDLVRNVMVSPQTGLSGGLADLRPVAGELDARIMASSVLSGLPGKFLFVLDDGRGDLVEHWCDLGLVLLDEQTAQIRVGQGWGDVVPLAEAVDALIALAEHFVAVRGSDEHAAWHVDELATPLVGVGVRDDRVPPAVAPLGFGAVPGGRHVEIGEAGIGAEQLDALFAETDEVVVTPWYGVLVPAGRPA